MSHEPDVQLEFVDTEALLEELLGRFDHAVFAGLKYPENMAYQATRLWKGNPFTCNGLANIASMAIMDDLYHGEDEDDDDESDVVPDDDDEC
jgi:hypothetical protein